MTPTRRDTLKMTVGAALAAVGMKPLTTAASRAAEPVDWRTYEIVFIAMGITAGVSLADGDADVEKLYKHMMFGDPLPPDCEWARERCREVLRVVSARLEATS